MSFTFKNFTPGVYFVALNGDTVGSIRKQSASKWITYDLTDKPIQVTKTLKEAKSKIETESVFKPLDKVEEIDYNHSVAVEDEAVDNTLDLQEQMLNSMKTYTVNSDGDFVELEKQPTFEIIKF